MFYGREDLLEQLGALLERPMASLVTCRGRRRIGKSTLIEEFVRRNGLRFVKLEGLSPREAASNERQLAAFARQLSAQKPDGTFSFEFDIPESATAFSVIFYNSYVKQLKAVRR